MFFSTLSLGLALMPFVSAAIIDIQVGQTGLTYSPDAIVCLLSNVSAFAS